MDTACIGCGTSNRMIFFCEDLTRRTSSSIVDASSMVPSLDDVRESTRMTDVQDRHRHVGHRGGSAHYRDDQRSGISDRDCLDRCRKVAGSAASTARWAHGPDALLRRHTRRRSPPLAGLASPRPPQHCTPCVGSARRLSDRLVHCAGWPNQRGIMRARRTRPPSHDRGDPTASADGRRKKLVDQTGFEPVTS